MAVLKRTPLYPLYAGYPSARCIDFGSWELPVQFLGITFEHEAVRTRAGLFDVSHMGEFIVTGQYAETFVQRLTTNDVAKLTDGQAQYTLMCTQDGGTVDDLLVYKLSADQFMLVVNASNIEKDWQWLMDHLIGDVFIRDVSSETALLALQGPRAAAILSQVVDANAIASLKPFHFVRSLDIDGVQALVSRTGYTGEDGFELYVPAGDAQQLWRSLIVAGQPEGLVPCGLGARDTLRFEARLPLYGQELADDISPLEAGLGPFVKLDKGPFISSDALSEQRRSGLKRKLVGIEMIDRGIPRSRYPIHAEGQIVGAVTTGTQSPTLKRNLGLALVETPYAALGTKLLVEIRGKLLRAQVVPTPFYKRS
ncbi:aminomethyltransferase [Paenibacillus phyllosphaerae]|uniref:Aminomethyltransferase n=1 Tax=Paenibacillus phyllosphaerae TaxID=274593 RepID=A0A7W5FPS1_9BACL|nr:glycine cleavage system aminomethyltransferase GcvT [Paenibacillus phyllosphaerae]MBB3112528.1 aminomethyltransferase [Paenibacillus phyllosphaerae]